MRKNRLMLCIAILVGTLAMLQQNVQAFADVAPEPAVLGGLALLLIGIFIVVGCLLAFIVIKLSKKKNDINKPN